jgi:hypothetical protein
MKIPGCSFPPESILLMGFCLAYLVNLFGRIMTFVGDLMESKERPVSLD